jgi:hypothetical protein
VAVVAHTDVVVLVEVVEVVVTDHLSQVEKNYF